MRAELLKKYLQALRLDEVILMLCERCGANNAEVHLMRIVNGNVQLTIFADSVPKK